MHIDGIASRLAGGSISRSDRVEEATFRSSIYLGTWHVSGEETEMLHLKE